MAKSLAHLVDEVPPTSPQSVPDSCGEESSDEETSPKPLSGISRPAAGPSNTTFRSPMAASNRAALSGEGSVETVAGGGGRKVYSTVRGNHPPSYFTVQWRKPQTKKHKTWDGDAVIKIEGSRIVMLSETGDHMGTCALLGGMPTSGTEMRIGSYEVEVDCEISADDFKRSTCILNKPLPKAVPIGYAPSTYAKPFKAPTQTQTPRSSGVPIKATPIAKSTAIRDDAADQNRPVAGPSKPETNPSAPAYKAIRAESFYSASKPRADKIVIGEKSRKQRNEWGGARYDPNAEGAVVMKRPDEKEARRRGTEIVDVVLDPFLAAKMREHQREGVKFMYSCVMGSTAAEAEGCILADEMGSGKTLQTIGLIHTLSRQSPFANQSSVIGKALIVCPVSSVENWKKEFRKWVRPDHINAVAADGGDHVVKAFTHHRGQQVLIIGYERLRKVIGQLASCQPPIDSIVCDEGHRLKSKDNKTTKMFNALRTQRRIILSGTPVQNDSSEYFAMVDFTCPGLLGTYNQFAKHYEKPIMKSRTPGCPATALEDGRMRAEELGKLSKEFVLRRTANVLEHYLPPKHEYVVFVAPSIHQLKAYSRILNPNSTRQVVSGEAGTQPLGYIDLMRKVANTPMILRLKQSAATQTENIARVTHSASQDIPKDMNDYDVTVSGKSYALDKMLYTFHRTTNEKVVVVSNFTSTSNVIQEVCKSKGYPYLRLDGQTPQKQRIEAVDLFNRQAREQSFVFSSSAKAGGVGINLIGASRSILFDSDWNPSTDLQAMARIHRDGQKKPVYIYRLLTTNTIDEKIYQRQITKTGLANQMMDHDATQERTRDSFTAAELRDIFTVKLHTDGCQTHDSLLCNCIAEGPAPAPSPIASHASDEDDDEFNQGFMPASQYDPEPNPKMLKKAAVEQREKSAELKHWSHMDAFDVKSFKNIADTVLHNSIWDDWVKTGGTVDTSASVSEVASTDIVADEEDPSDMAPDSEPDSDAEPVKRRKSRRVAKNDGRDDLRFLTDDEFDNVSGRSHEGGAGKDQVVGTILSDEEIIVPSKRKSTSVSRSTTRTVDDGDRSRSSSRKTAASKAGHRDQGMVSFNELHRKHNLMALAEADQTGRIMFVFEKVSQSKM